MRLTVDIALRWLAPEATWSEWRFFFAAPAPQNRKACARSPRAAGKAQAAIHPSHVPYELAQSTGDFVLGAGGRVDHRAWLHGLAFLARHFLEWGRNGIALRGDPERVLKLQRLLERAHLEPLMAFAWVVDLDALPEETVLAVRDYRPFLRAFTPRALEKLWSEQPLVPTPQWPELEALQGEGLIEPHRHLSGAGLLPLFWLDLLRERRSLVKHPELREVARMLEALCALRRVLQERLRAGAFPPRFSPCSFWDALFRDPAHSLRQPWPVDPDLRPSVGAGGKDRDLIRERRFLYGIVWACVKNHDDVWLHRFAHAYIAWQMHVWRALIQRRSDEVGFARFDRKHASPLRYLGSGRLARRYLQARRTGHVRRCEWRVTPGYLQSTAKELEELEEVSRGLAPRAQVGAPCVVEEDRLVCHWVRASEDYVQREGQRRRGLGDLRRFLCSKRYKWISGLDVANSEFHGRIAEYAWVFRRVRHVWPFQPFFSPRPGVDRLHPMRLRFVPHAGEDFRHILSGMRAMDETMRFFGLRSGDRLGHGLAMGLDPTLWFARIGREIALPAGEWLDDLVWFRQKLIEIGEHPEVVLQVERVARPLVEEIYGKPMPWDVLEKAWRARVIRRADLFNPQMRESALLLRDKDVKFVWHMDWEELKLAGRHLLRAQPRTPGRRRLQAVRAYTPEAWDEAIRTVQEAWLAELKARGVAIEVNPTSNLCISVIRDIDEHPIFRWFPPEGDAKAHVLVGSDDPGVFATELAFEYAALLAAAKRMGRWGEETLYRWLERLHRNAEVFCRPS
ncbi:MAG: hypothetical protein D6771_07185 [Zetaproteobacteria bacterium]|nr:MAG: hypothetical protein D6771_07185 [Zetaproteobacteria bacterium]